MNKIFALAVSLIFVSGFTTAEASPLTLEDINSLKQVATARINPAGDRIAYLLQVPREIYVDDDGKPYHELHVTDLNGNSIPYVTGDVEITDIAWAADGKSIFFLVILAIYPPHHLYEPIKQVMAVFGPGGCFRVVLHTKRRLAFDPNSFEGSIK